MCPDFHFAAWSAMASHGHRDVNLPPATWHRASSFLGEFNVFLQALGFSPWAVDKERGGHLTNFWLYCTMDRSSPAKSQVQFGCTNFAAVNPIPHAYARGKGKHLSAAVDLLENFISEVWAFQEQAQGDAEPTPAQQHDENWHILDMRQFVCPSTERIWFSCEDGSIWFMPRECGTSSLCGEWRAYRDAGCGVWWCNERSGQLCFPVAV